jgi:Protein of unknown function (DUF2905)
MARVREHGPARTVGFLEASEHMSSFSDLGRILLILGVSIAVVGLILVFAGRIPMLGRLPGDVFIRRGNVSFFFPIVTCIVGSIVLTVVVNLLLLLFRRH